LLLLPFGLRAQLALTTADGTSLGPSYNLGSVAAGTSKDIELRAYNLGLSAIPVSTLAIAGSGFSIASPLTRPANIPPGNFQEIVIHFAGGPPASYSANFQINTISVLLVITSVPSATLRAVSGCAGPDPSTGVLAFPQVQAAQIGTCTLSLQNFNSQTISVGSVTVSGATFSLSKAVATPLTLSPGAAVSFAIVFAPPAAAVDSGVLTVDSQMFSLTGTAVNLPLPALTLTFDSGAPASNQQRTLTLHLPSPSPVAATGAVTLTFQPDTTLVGSDSAVMFLSNGMRVVPFTIHAGDTSAAFGGQSSAVFQTGTTSGKITFTVTASVALTGDPTTAMIIPPAPIFIQSASAVARAGALDVQVFGGFDNTYSAGNMSFTFYDLSGKAIRSTPVSADFTAAFRSYFISSGSVFQMLVTFPVMGQANQIGSVDFSMTNSAGTVARRLNFINDTGQCVLITASELSCPGP
jgi:hypothetical protein